MKIRDMYWYHEGCERGGFVDIEDEEHPLFGRHDGLPPSVGDEVVAKVDDGPWRLWRVIGRRATMYTNDGVPITSWLLFVEDCGKIKSAHERRSPYGRNGM